MTETEETEHPVITDTQTVNSRFSPNKFLHSQTAKKRVIIFLTILVCVLGASIAFLENFKGSKNSIVEKPLNSLSNVLVVLDAKVDDYTNPSALTVEFNQPIDLHEFEHAVTLIPDLQGKWTLDQSDSSIVRFTFDEEFKGKYISLYLAEGLVSENHKTLIKDYENHFTMIRERQDEPYSKVRSFPVGSEIHLNSSVSSITLYKSNAQNLLSFLRYSVEGDNRGGVYDSKYTQTAVKHAEREKVANIKSNEYGDVIYLDPGVYYVENDEAEPYFIVVSSFGVALRQDDQKVLLNAFDIQKGTRITDDVTFGLYNLKNDVNLLSDFKYSESNPFQPLIYPTRLDAVIGIHNNEVAFVPVELPTSMADIQVSSNLDTDTKIFIYTDRPIYKPGDTVFVRGVVRQDSDSLYKLPVAGTPIYLTQDGYEKTPVTQTVMLDEYGTFYSQFVIPQDYSIQYSSIFASMKPFSENTYGYSSANFEVLKYTKPEFEIKTRVEKSEQLRSDKLKFTITGNYFDGQPLQNKEVNYTLYTQNYYEVEKAVYNSNFNITSASGMCGGGGFQDYFGNDYHTGTVTLNDRGEATVEVDSDKASLLSQKVTLVARVNDSQNEILSAVNTIVHASELNIFFIPSTNNYMAGEEVVIPFYAESLSGEKIRNTTFRYALTRTEYGTYGENKQIELTAGSVDTDENGKGIARFTLAKDLEPGQLQFIVSTKDSKQNVSENQKYLSIMSSEDKEARQVPGWGSYISQTYLKITSSQNSFKVNDTVNLSIDSPQELDVLVTLERGRIYSPSFVHLNKGMNQLQFPITPDLSPSITVVFTFFADGKYYSEGMALNVPAMHKLLQVDLSANKSVYSPDETAELLIKTKDADGVPVSAQMSVGVVDKAIYALRKSATPPIHSSFYYFRPRRTNASSSLTGFGDWGGWGGGGGGGDGVGKATDVLYWNPNVRTDSSGEARIQVPLLGYKTIWKVQVLGSTVDSQVGQADTEFTVTSEVKGASTQRKFWFW